MTTSDDETCICPHELARDLDHELRRHRIVVPSLVEEFTLHTGPQVHLGVTTPECAEALLNLLRASR